jgi:alkylated DNA repair protein (DNA oxidative demethylase)
MDLFNELTPNCQEIAKDTFLLRGFALTNEVKILADLAAIISQSPLRHMMTPMGFAMSAAMTNCGDLGWISNSNGYRYDALDPQTRKPWPAMPISFLELAQNAAIEAGFNDFKPDACLVNQYKVGASMGLHQDKNELDFTQPIVSVSLGIPATFQFGGLSRSDKPIKMLLTHGDIVVWGGDSRLKYHGIMPLKPNIHGVLGPYRFNLTFRKAG